MKAAAQPHVLEWILVNDPAPMVVGACLMFTQRQEQFDASMHKVMCWAQANVAPEIMAEFIRQADNVKRRPRDIDLSSLVSHWPFGPAALLVRHLLQDGTRHLRIIASLPSGVLKRLTLDAIGITSRFVHDVMMRDLDASAFLRMDGVLQSTELRALLKRVPPHAAYCLHLAGTSSLPTQFRREMLRAALRQKRLEALAWLATGQFTASNASSPPGSDNARRLLTSDDLVGFLTSKHAGTRERAMLLLGCLQHRPSLHTAIIGSPHLPSHRTSNV
jgi:hypothetical protein